MPTPEVLNWIQLTYETGDPCYIRMDQIACWWPRVRDDGTRGSFVGTLDSVHPMPVQETTKQIELTVRQVAL